MSAHNGGSPEMPAENDVLTLDDGTAERLLRGALTVDDAPPAYRNVAVLIAALNADASDAELAGERRMVPFIARRIAETTSESDVTATKRGPHRLRVAVLSLVVVTALLMSLATAGALPGDAQRFAADVLNDVGISVPSPDSHASDSGASTNSTDSNRNGATVSDVAHSDSTSVDYGSDVSSIASDGQSNAGVNNGNHTGQVTPKPGQVKQDTTTTTKPHVNNGNHTGQADAASDSGNSSEVTTTAPAQSP